jgi:hypothetical protein
MIIGISGYARTGKDTIADILTEEFGFERLAFADKLRECVYALNPILGESTAHSPGIIAMKFYLQDVIDEYGWDGVKSSHWGPEVRRLLQRFGTEVGRNILGENIWVDSTFLVTDVTKDYIITDCRFRNEAMGILRQGGKMWRVNRPGVGPVNDHISEIGLDNFPFDAVIDNDGDLTDLRNSVRLLLN